MDTTNNIRTWNVTWYSLRYHFLRRLSRLLGMPQPTEINRALKNERWRAYQEAREHYLGNCPEHPEELMLSTGRGFYKCCSCWNASYFQMLDSSPITDPLQVQDLHFPGRLVRSFNRARAHGVGVDTAINCAIPPQKTPRLTKRLDKE